MPRAPTVLLMIVTLGMMINFLMFMVVLSRKTKIRKTGEKSKDRIVRLTLSRALWMEAGFFLCQGVRFVHTLYEVRASNICADDGWAVLERGFVTLVLVALSVRDLLVRRVLAYELETLQD